MDRLVSVVIPVFNSRNYLEECVSSVLNQTYADIEVLLVDDGSTDGCSDICDAFAQLDKRVKVFHKPNGGVSNARNTGIIHAGGRYITFVDSDDTVDPEMIEAMVSMIDGNEPDLVVTALQEDPQKPMEACFSLSPEDNAWICYLLEKYLIFGPCQKLYSAERIHDGKITFPENMSYGEDLVFNLDYLKSAETVGFLNRAFYHYNRENHDSLSQKTRWDMFENDMNIHRILRTWLQNRMLLNTKSEQILYRRVIDTAYNSVNLTFKKNAPWRGIQQRQYFETISTEPLVVESLQNGDTGGYAPWIIDAMRKKRIVVLELAAGMKRGVDR